MKNISYKRLSSRDMKINQYVASQSYDISAQTDKDLNTVSEFDLASCSGCFGTAGTAGTLGTATGTYGTFGSVATYGCYGC